MNKKSLILTQVLMTFMMASLMSGIMSLIYSGFSMEWLMAWPKQIIIAWPIAFVLTSGVRPASMAIVRMMLTPRETKKVRRELKAS